MFAQTDAKISPWYVVNSDDKKRARIDRIAHLLAQVPYNELNLCQDRAASTATRYWLQAPKAIELALCTRASCKIRHQIDFVDSRGV